MGATEEAARRDVPAEPPRDAGGTEAQFRLLFEHSPTALWLEDLSAVRRRVEDLRRAGVESVGAWLAANPDELSRILPLIRIIDVNRAAVALFGAASREELLTALPRTFTPLTFHCFRRGVEAVAEGRPLYDGETEFLSLAGAPLYCLVHWVVLPGSEGTYDRVLLSMVDITQRRRSEELFRRIAGELFSRMGEEYFAALADFVCRELGTDLAFVGRLLPGERRIETIAVSARGGAAANFAYDLAGTPSAALLEEGVCFFPEGVQARFPEDRRLAEAGFTSCAGIPLLASDGRPLGVLATMGTRPLAAGDRERIVDLLRIFGGRAGAEIERREAEESLRRSEEFIKNIVDSVDEAFLVIGRDFRIISCNRAYLSQTGTAAVDCVGRLCHEITHRRGHACWEAGEDCAVRATFASGEPRSAVHEHRDGAGRIFRVETRAYPLRDRSGAVTGAIEIINNVTERMRLEEQLRQAQKMEAVGLLAGGIAHDFNNILSAIVGYASLLGLKLPPDSPGRPFAEQILGAGERAATLTQSLLAFSRTQLINPCPLDLNEVIRRVGKLLRRILGEDIELRTTLAAGPVTVVADGGQLEQALMNLATNARDAMPDGGTLSLETGRCLLDEAFVRAHGYGRAGEYAQLVVADTGVGMAQEVLGHIFEPFFTTKEVGRGTGLGLAMVYGAVRQNRGHIEAESAPGRGTVFRIWFPLVSAGGEEAAPRSPASVPERGSGLILLVEDDEAARQLYAAVLREFGYEVVEASDGAEALALFGALGRAVDLLILDVVMPKRNGREVFEQLRGLQPGIRALFVSGYTADIVHRRGVLEAGLEFLGKPFTPQALLAKVREVISPGR